MTSISPMDQFIGHPYERLIRRIVRDQWWVKYRNIPWQLMTTKLKGERMPYGYETVAFPVFNEAELERWHVLDVLSQMTGDRLFRNHCWWMMNILVIQAIDRSAWAPDILLVNWKLPDELTLQGFLSQEGGTGVQYNGLAWRMRDVPLHKMLMKGGH
jgi:hypothetical protein